MKIISVFLISLSICSSSLGASPAKKGISAEKEYSLDDSQIAALRNAVKQGASEDVAKILQKVAPISQASYEAIDQMNRSDLKAKDLELLAPKLMTAMQWVPKDLVLKKQLSDIATEELLKGPNCSNAIISPFILRHAEPSLDELRARAGAWHFCTEYVVGKLTTGGTSEADGLVEHGVSFMRDELRKDIAMIFAQAAKDPKAASAAQAEVEEKHAANARMIRVGIDRLRQICTKGSGSQACKIHEFQTVFLTSILPDTKKEVVGSYIARWKDAAKNGQELPPSIAKGLEVIAATILLNYPREMVDKANHQTKPRSDKVI